LGALSTSTYNFGQGTGGQEAAYTVTQLANADLHWQSTTQWNVGLDFSVLKIASVVRLMCTIKIQRHFIALRPAPSNGAVSTIKNLGETKGHGRN
jgi:hypothetical protein